MKYTGPWADEPQAAITAALTAVNVDRAEYVELQFHDSLRFEPIDPDRSSIEVEVLWSETRQQYRTRLIR